MMEESKKLKLFISYSHQDNLDSNLYVEEFKKHITPLKDNGLIEDWYDRKILPGNDFVTEIGNNLEDADIICLFISSNFLSSNSCKKEKQKALELSKKKRIPVIPIILSPCGWQDDRDISSLLALPTDGKSVSSFKDRNEAWNDVYNGLKKVIEKELIIKQLIITEEFGNFLQDVEMLTKAHSQKERILLDDIFVYPEVDKYDALREYEEKISSEELLKNLLEYPKIVIAGEGQSGKTTLCKVIFKELRNKNLVPVYVFDKKTQFEGKIENKILHSFRNQYEGVNISEIDKDRIVPIIDNFHLAKKRGKHIRDLSMYSHCVLVVDDIFNLNIGNEKLIRSFGFFRIREFKPSLRNELVKKWMNLTDKETCEIRSDIELYKDIDRTTELINCILGKTIGRGIMPAYPFFILSTIVTYETFAMPLDQEITSQGYCYQAFIYFYLRKQGVRNDEIDTYVNFLTELAVFIHKEKKYELSSDDFNSFIKLYLEKYNLPIKQQTLLKNLIQILSIDSFNNYSFRYPYLYYFFVAKYIAEHIEDKVIKEEMNRIMHNLHVNENGYIAVFIVHHTRNTKILEEIELNALCLFDKYKPSTLSKDEVEFFDKEANIIVQAVLPPADTTPEIERANRLKTQDKFEQSQENAEQRKEINEDDSLEIELRRAIKTVEVTGTIIKNRAGSLEKTKLEEMFKEAMNVHLRILSSFFEIIRGESEQDAITDFIAERLKEIVEEKRRKPSEEKLKEIARTIFWNLNFITVYGYIRKTVHSLGSDKLKSIVEKVCNEVNTPASFLVKHGILMWHNKNLQVERVAEKVKEKDFSKIAKRAIQFMIVNYCSLHPINYKDRQKIESKLGIPRKKLLTRGYKEP